MGTLGATWAETLTTDTGDVSQAEWDDMRFGMFCTSASTFADWKKTIEKLCSVSNKCTYEVKQEIERFFYRVEDMNWSVAVRGRRR